MTSKPGIPLIDVELLGPLLKEALQGAVLDWDPDEGSYGLFLMRRVARLASESSPVEEGPR